MDKKKQGDLQDVMAEESRRGRRPIDLGAQRARREKLASLRKLLEIGTEEEFVKAMLAFGLSEESAEFSACLETWKKYRP
jgi:hypothetical protein